MCSYKVKTCSIFDVVFRVQLFVTNRQYVSVMVPSAMYLYQGRCMAGCSLRHVNMCFIKMFRHINLYICSCENNGLFLNIISIT